MGLYASDNRRGKGRLVGWRNRLLASPRFQNWAAALPVSRRIARGRARDLFDLVAGFVYSQVTFAMVESGLLKVIAERPVTLDAASAAAALPRDSTARLLAAAASLGLAEQTKDDRWTLGPRGAALVGNPGVQAMIRHHRLLYADLADPLALLRAGPAPGGLADLWTYGAGAREVAVADYSALMAASQPMVAEQALAAYRFGRHQRMLDVGGGEGAFLTAIARAAPRLALGLFDLPAVAARARERLEAAGLAARTIVHEGSFTTDPLPAGYDLLTLVRVLHDHDDAQAAALLAQVRAALPARGRLLIVEPMAGTRGAESVGAYFGFYLLAMGSGRPRTPREIISMLRASGFTKTRLLRTPLPLVARAIVATV